MATTSPRDRLRMVGQLDLGDHIEIATGEQLWSIQKKIATALSVPNAQVAVASCNASGKTWLAARLAIAFYDAFTPGTPCSICGGPCKGAKVITTSSTDTHLKKNLWGEIRLAWPKIEERVGIVGSPMPADSNVVDSPNHFITGLVATHAESFQGYHAAHILIIGDEATSVDEQVKQGIIGLLASGDARLLLIFNPTDTTTYAYSMWKSTRTQSFTISAYHTPYFTGDPAPEGAPLINPEFLEDLKAAGMGEGTYEWTTRVLGEFWDLSEDALIADTWYEAATQGMMFTGGTRQLGIDIASYGTAESVIVVRDGPAIIDVRVVPAGRVDHFFQGPVVKAIQDYAPHYVVYDADGVGAGAIGYAEALLQHMPPGGQVIPFRGAKKLNDQHTNARSQWYWALRRQFENGIITVAVNDKKLRDQLTQIRYSIQQGAIRVETKDEMKKRGFASPDRADAVMYAFAYSDLPIPISPSVPHMTEGWFNVRDNRETAMWDREQEQYDGAKPEVHPLLGVEDW